MGTFEHDFALVLGPGVVFFSRDVTMLPYRLTIHSLRSIEVAYRRKLLISKLGVAKR